MTDTKPVSPSEDLTLASEDEALTTSPSSRRLFGDRTPPLVASLHLSEGPSQSGREQRRVTMSDCGCGCGESGKCSCEGGGIQKSPQLVYALGQLGYDFGSEAKRDSLVQAMPPDLNNPVLPAQLLQYLTDNPFDAASVIWTLNLDATPIYAIQPAGPFANIAYDRLREYLAGQQLADADPNQVELVSVPGVVGGRVRLQSGQILPMIVPAVRGMFSWAPKALVIQVLGPREAAPDPALWDTLAAGLTDFLNRVYYDLRNLGVTAETRALNYSATNAVQATSVIRSATVDGLDLDTVDVKKSPVCRPDSDCYDVELVFFDPNNTNTANRIHRFTIDVSDVIPVTVGAVRSWTRRG